MADEDRMLDSNAFEFTATWRDFLPIAASNLALTIVTLGFYRFWAKARERRYLWAHTRFIDDRLEWTGTGKEMFIGFMIVSVVLVPAVLFLNFGMQTMVLRGHGALAGAIALPIYFGFLYLYNVARFRSLRYRLARTWWHGIRGGSDNPGFGYGWAAVWRNVVAAIPFAALIPWAMTRLWNRRWNAMSFGAYAFTSDVTTAGLKRRWLLLMSTPVIGVVLMMPFAASGVSKQSGEAGVASAVGFAGLLLVGTYVLLGLAGVGYYAAFFRKAVGHLRLGPMSFAFEARSKDWLLLFLGDLALLVCTLGLGVCFLGYRHWSFFIRHLSAAGVIVTEEMTQSRTHAPREAEGLADAFDIGAI